MIRVSCRSLNYKKGDKNEKTKEVLNRIGKVVWLWVKLSIVLTIIGLAALSVWKGPFNGAVSILIIDREVQGSIIILLFTILVMDLPKEFGPFRKNN